MSRMMLHAVLKMPHEVWSNDLLDKSQRNAKYHQASDVIEGLDIAIQKMTDERKILQDLLKEFAGEAKDPRVKMALAFGDDEDWID